ncbi:putative MFS-type transporter [Escovopsis weberi]|uniref:Putative MFS-type transporter n=1 Tax=Escovopsis weberi TaxID=150374 RepID=A0A0M9VRZ4_ESCWE|nr:putative MFS-type transporter [Escovopsis weberi]
MANQPTRHSHSASSDTIVAPVQDPESLRQAPGQLSYWRTLIDQGAITSHVLHHKYAGQGTPDSPYLVEWLPSDPRNPMEFSNGKKWTITLVQALATLAVSFTSSAYSGGVFEVIREFNISQEVSILGVSLFVLGFSIGPLFFAPLSELFGRQRLFFVSYLCLTAFNAGAAAAPSMASLIVLRFLAGSFGSAPLTNAGGVIADMFPAAQRGIATSIFSLAPFLGPALGPIAGGFLGQAAGWRWVEGMTAIFTGVLWIMSTFTYPETYAPVLLRQRAATLSRATGKVYVSKLDASQPSRPVSAQLALFLCRPWILLFKEPVVLLISIYMAIIYGTLYMCFAAFPIVFQGARGWSVGISGLAFVGIACGMTLSIIGTILDNKRYQRLVAAAPGGVVPPEARLPSTIIGSVLIPVGLFWFAWTNGPEIHWAVCIVGSSVFAAGIALVFLSSMNYIIDSYVIFAASALAANSVLRSLFGFAFPLFTTYMYKNLGIHWASSIPAFLAVACMPFPLLFYKYGAIIRSKCMYAAEAARALEKMRAQQVKVTEDEAAPEAEPEKKEPANE